MVRVAAGEGASGVFGLRCIEERARPFQDQVGNYAGAGLVAQAVFEGGQFLVAESFDGLPAYIQVGLWLELVPLEEKAQGGDGGPLVAPEEVKAD